MSQFDELPEGWVETTLGELGNWSSGGTPLRKHSEYYEGNIPWVKTGDLTDGEIEEIDEFITDKGLNNSSAKIFPKNSLLVAMYGATIGKLGILKQPSATNQACAALLSEGLTEKLIPFAFYYLLSSREDLRKIGQGGAQPNISQAILKEYVCPLPPLNEQRRIVEKIEALTARSRKARAALDQIPALLDQFRQSVLAAAFRGDLTADWRAQNPDVETAEALLERIRKNILEEYDDAVVKAKQLGLKKPKKHGLISTLKEEYEDMNHIVEDWQNLPDEWEAVKLNILFDHGCLFDGPFGSNLKTKDYVDSGIRVIRLENVAPLHFIDDKKTFITAEKYRELEKHTVNPGDLIFASFVSEGVRTCILPKLETLAIAKADCFCLRPDENLIDKEYLALILSSPQFFFELKKISHGATRVRINTSQLRDSYIPLASPKEQMEIVARVLNVFSIIGQLQEDYLNNEKKLDQLDRSILAKAFRGELVPQDPTDEPASVLLDRIRAEQDKKEKTKRKKRV